MYILKTMCKLAMMYFRWLLAQPHHRRLPEGLKAPSVQFCHVTNLSLVSSLQGLSGISLAVLAFYIHVYMLFWCNKCMCQSVRVELLLSVPSFSFLMFSTLDVFFGGCGVVSTSKIKEGAVLAILYV